MVTQIAVSTERMSTVPTVAHLVISLAHGGLERLVVDWANRRNAQHPGSTRICCLDEPGDLAAQVEAGALNCLHAQRGRLPWDAAAVRTLRYALLGTHSVSSQPFAIVHSHNLAAQQYAFLGRICTKVAHVHTQHGANIHNQGLVDRLRGRALARFTHRLVAVSQSTAEAMQSAYGISRRRIAVIPNGIAPLSAGAGDGVSREEVRRPLGIPADAFVVGSIGRLDAVKGYDRLLSALASAAEGDATGADSLRRARLLLVGDGPARTALEAQARSLGFSGRVVFAGFRPDARRLAEAMDLFVLPSRSEGLSVALLEAMAAGVPVMATDAGDNRAILENGAAGIMLPPEESEWPRLLREQATEPGRRAAATRTERARRRVEESYSMDSTLAAYEATYRAVTVGPETR